MNKRFYQTKIYAGLGVVASYGSIVKKSCLIEAKCKVGEHKQSWSKEVIVR